MTGETPGGGYCGYPVAGYCVTGAPQVVVCGGDAAKWIKNQLCFNYIHMGYNNNRYFADKGIAVFQELPLLTGAFDHKTDILRCLLFSSDDNHNRCDEEYRCGD